MQGQGPGYAPYAEGTSPQYGRYPAQRIDGFHSSSAPAYNDVSSRSYPPIQPYNNSVQDSDHVSNPSLSYGMRQNNGHAVDVSGTAALTISSSTTGRYHQPISAATTPTSSYSPNLSQSPMYSGIGSWDNTTHSTYPAPPPEDHRGRVNLRLNIKGLPGRSLRSESTEAHRHHR
ncbi:hypothetical protein LZ30DRAFT_602955 [Colletotrichum cereale]|nr:hypothetical protein LZ30DRAFT_602955 [Colletotrichum cereale]